MNFLCDQCKQKYHVADEKLRGRAVTRFRCKKCEHIIELLAPSGSAIDAPAEGSVPAVPTTPPAADPVGTPRAPLAPHAPQAPRPRAATMSIPMNAQNPRTGRSAVASISASAAPAASGPSAASAAARPAAPRPRAATTTGPTFGAGGGVSAPRPSSAVRTAPSVARPSAVRPASAASAILNASETGWYAGIRDLPVGPLTRKELGARVQAGDVDPDTLVWREGLDDWRPLRSVAELGDLLRMAAQRMSGELLDEMGKPSAPERARGGHVVPLSSARAAPLTVAARDEDEPSDDEATHVSTMDRALLEAIKPTARSAPPASRVPTPAPQPASVPPPSPSGAAPMAARSTPSVRPAPEHSISGPRVASPALGSVAAPLAPTSVPPVADADESAVAARAEVHVAASATAAAVAPAAVASDGVFGSLPPAAESVRPAAGVVPTMLAPVVASPMASGASPAPSIPLPGPGRQTSGLVVLLVGVAVTGVFGGLMLGRLNNHPPPAPLPMHPPAPLSPMRTVSPPMEIPAEVPPTVQAPQPTVPPPVAGPVAPAPDNPAERGRMRHVATTPEPRAPSAADLRLLREVGQMGGGPVTGPVAAAPSRSATEDSASTGATGSARSGRVIQAFNSARIINNCWQASLRLNPALGQQATRVTVDITVDGHGRVTDATVANSPHPSFTSCVQIRARGLPPLGGGEAVTARAFFNLDVNN